MTINLTELTDKADIQVSPIYAEFKTIGRQFFKSDTGYLSTKRTFYSLERMNLRFGLTNNQLVSKKFYLNIYPLIIDAKAP